MIVLRPKKFKLFILFFSLFFIAEAQQLQLHEYYNQQIATKDFSVDEKEQFLDSLLHENNIKIDTLKLIKIYRSFLTDLRHSNYKKSFRLIDKIERLTVLSDNYDIEDIKIVHRNKILFLYNTQKYYEVLKNVNLYLDKYPEKDAQLGKVYRLIANTYSDLGDLQKAIDNFDKSIYISRKQNDNKGLALSLRDKLGIYIELEDSIYNREIGKLLEQTEALKKVYDFDDKLEKAYRNNLGCFFDFLGDYSKANINYEKALDISMQTEDFEKVFDTYINLGVLSKKEKKIEKALEYLQKASEYTYDEKYKEAMVFNNLADIYKLQNNYKNALIHYQKAITQALHSKELPYQTLPKFEDIELSPNKIDILGYLIDKSNGWIAYYEAEKNAKYLENSLETFALADSLVDVIYVESREDLSKLFWRKKSATFYPKAVEVCHRLQQPEKAFFFMEKNKAILLLENMTDATAKRLSKLPKEILKREQDLIKKIKTLEGEIQMSSYTESHIDTLKDNIFDYKKELNAFIDSLETNYPKYYKYKKNKKVVTLQEVQSNLQKDELILQYIVGKEKGFVTLISPETIQLKELPSTARLRETVATYKNAVSKPFVNVDDKNKYEEVATLLYQQLFPFSETLSQKQMTIIPDDVLQYIPFEALRAPTNEYLIENTQIQYNYSLSSAAQSQQNRMSSGSSFIAIAPTKFLDEQYATLTTSSAELEKLTRIFGANHFQYENATKKRFTEAYGNYKIVHLSTHGGLDNTIPWLAFYDEKITLDELYFTKNQSELVVLSACKTSDGELKKGEGVMSLARGFFNAGAKSVISSLWDINEKASTEIIEEFYKNIVAGDSKSGALQKAKLTYIQNNENTSEASPYYWSALTLTGDESPIKLSANGYLYYIFGGILLTGIVLYIRRKRNKKEVA